MSKMRGIGTDGAATMIGKHNGVVTRLKAITPTAISVHCCSTPAQSSLFTSYKCGTLCKEIQYHPATII